MMQASSPPKKKNPPGLMLGDAAWQRVLKDHQKRVSSMKAAIVITEPWSMRNSLKPSRPSSARAPPSSRRPQKSDAGAKPRPGTARRDVRPAVSLYDLSQDQQFVCEDMIDLLLTLSSESSRFLVEQILLLSEERRLLRGYNGVFPGLAPDAVAAEETPAAETPAVHKPPLSSPSAAESGGVPPHV